MGRLAGKVAVVTGASSGIGLAAAQRFAAEGAKVVVVGRDEDALQRASAGVAGLVPVVADVGNRASLDALRERVAAVHGPVDVLFANAGILAMGPFDKVGEDDFDRMIGTNLKGISRLCCRRWQQASDESRFVTGTDLLVDGGYTRT